jgi:hypothetical protein
MRKGRKGEERQRQLNTSFSPQTYMVCPMGCMGARIHGVHACHHHSSCVVSPLGRGQKRRGEQLPPHGERPERRELRSFSSKCTASREKKHKSFRSKLMRPGVAHTVIDVSSCPACPHRLSTVGQTYRRFFRNRITRTLLYASLRSGHCYGRQVVGLCVSTVELSCLPLHA